MDYSPWVAKSQAILSNEPTHIYKIDYQTKTIWHRELQSLSCNNIMEKNLKRKYMNHFALLLKLTQHYQSSMNE